MVITKKAASSRGRRCAGIAAVIVTKPDIPPPRAIGPALAVTSRSNLGFFSLSLPLAIERWKKWWD
jgi:hypothetical protein